MEEREKEDIRQAVREKYGRIAKSQFAASGSVRSAPCCGESANYQGVAQAVSCCSSKDISAQRLFEVMGYSKEQLNSAPPETNMGLGCGNPVTLASLKPGETVVDLGSGGGFDCFLAAKMVGKAGKVIGVDMTSDMISKARKSANEIGAENVEFRLGEIEHLPIADNSADIIMSNCVINLSPDKMGVYLDAYRILKPGGRLAISDIVATGPLPEKIQRNLEHVSACVGGAATIEDTEKLLKEAGFQKISITTDESSRELIREWAPSERHNVADYVVSARIEAVKST
jgi:arsenite methyltransferase